MRIVIDVSPLSVPRTGIGNYVRGLVAGLLEVGGDRHEIVAFGPSGARTDSRGARGVEPGIAAAAPPARAVVADGLVEARPAERRGCRRPARRLPLLGLDVPAAA